MNSNELLQKLIAVKTFVNENNTEKEGMILLADLIKELVPTLNVELQQIGNDRVNLYAGNKTPEILFIGHFDTVQELSGWNTDPFTLTEKDGRLYGLGTADMKGSVAAFFSALASSQDQLDLSKIGILIYADEEYDFLGMKSFVGTSAKLNPRIIISLDGSLEVASGCRGCIELTVQLEGKTGHSSKALFGNNVILSGVKIFEILSERMLRFTDPLLGPTTCNLAYLQGGIRSQVNDQEIWQREGNIIPKDAELVIEVRPSVAAITAAGVIAAITELAKTLEISIINTKIRHDLAPLPVAYQSSEIEKIRDCYKRANVPFSLRDRYFSGYIDMAMLTKISNSPMILIGVGGTGHIPNESIAIADLKTCESLCKEILIEYCAK